MVCVVALGLSSMGRRTSDWSTTCPCRCWISWSTRPSRRSCPGCTATTTGSPRARLSWSSSRWGTHPHPPPPHHAVLGNLVEFGLQCFLELGMCFQHQMKDQIRCGVVLIPHGKFICCCCVELTRKTQDFPRLTTGANFNYKHMLNTFLSHVVKFYAFTQSDLQLFIHIYTVYSAVNHASITHRHTHIYIYIHVYIYIASLWGAVKVTGVLLRDTPTISQEQPGGELATFRLQVNLLYLLS